MRKFIIITALAMAVIGAISGGLAFRALSAGSNNPALAASQDIFSTMDSAQQDDQTGEKPWLGIRVARPPDGLTIEAVIADSPADNAGLKRLDIITAVDGTAVSDMKELLAALKDKQPGDTVTFSITRDGATQQITVTLEARPEPLPRAHPIFPELNGIPRDELFSHMLGGTFRFTDVDGTEHTVTTDLGTVTAVDTAAKTITVQLNSGGSPQTYTITEDVYTLPRDLSGFQANDRVSVVKVDGELRAIAKGAGRMLPFFGGGKHRGMRGFGGHGFFGMLGHGD